MSLKNLKIVALLPMKGISERVPKKNLKLFNGKPLYHYILQTLIKSRLIHKVCINTDCSDIKNDINSNFDMKKITIIDRPVNLCGNYVSMNEIISYDLSKTDFEYFLQTHSTNPLINVNTLDNAIDLFFKNLSKNTHDSIFSVNRVQKRFFDKNCKPLNHDPKMLVTQHLEPIFEENSCFYIFSKKSFNEAKSRIGKNPSMFEISKIESEDIDTLDDFKIAEIIHKYLNI